MDAFRYDFHLDVLIGFSGLFAAVSILWVLVVLFGALILGAVGFSLFGAIFFGLNRLADAASKTWSDETE